MRRLSVAIAVVLIATAAAAERPSAVPGSLSPEVEACFALAADELRGERSGLAKLNDAELQRRLQRQVMRDAGRPGVQAMLACILRKTAS